MHFIKLSTVLDDPMSFPWQHALFLPRDRLWELETRCAVIDWDEYEDPESEPEVVEQSLRYALGIAIVQDIVNNLEQQVASPNLEMRLKAFLYYYEYDAFIDVSRMEKAS
jgi:hypothetical protein